MQTQSPSLQTPQNQLLTGLVARLPEMYQPLYGHPELSGQVSRRCDDRLAHLTAVYRALSTAAGRPLRVLDLGCAQGYFSLHLAALGASVCGVEMLPVNVAVCETLAAENPELDVRFDPSAVERVIVELEPGTYDLVLGLSVFHHLVHHYGAANVRALIGRLAACIPSGIYEMALASEPPAWAAAQPANERELLGDYAFVHELDRIPTHLSALARPLFFASSTHWYFTGQCAPFSTATSHSHDRAGTAFLNTRRYYQNAETLTKVFALQGETAVANLTDIQNEIAFLRQNAAIFPGLPRVLASGSNGREAWVIRERIEGRLLYEMIGAGEDYDAQTILRNILDQLCGLEECGLYHSDLRLWNVVVRPGGTAALIDYGSILPHRMDQNWPNDVFYSFWIFVWGLTCGVAHPAAPMLPPFISPAHLPQRYRAWAARFARRPRTEWTFAILRHDFLSFAEAPAPDEELTHLETWMAAMELYVARLGDLLQANIETLSSSTSLQVKQMEALQEIARVVEGNIRTAAGAR